MARPQKAPSTTLRNIPKPPLPDPVDGEGPREPLADTAGLPESTSSAPPAFRPPDGVPQAAGFDESLRYPGEQLRFWISAALSLLFWTLLLVSIVLIPYGLFFLAFSLIARALFLANVRGNGVAVSERQLPHIHAAVVRASRRLGLETPPQTYVLQSEGSLNAFAMRLLSRDFVIVFSALIDACANQRQLDFVIAHEVGHLAAGHLRWMGFLAPANFVPWLGPAFSRAREYTCDRCGLTVVEEMDDADRGLLVLAAGGKSAMWADVESFIDQRLETGSFWSAAVELGSTHPYLCKRVAALREFQQPGSMAPIGRNPFAYLLAPFTGFGGPAGGGGGLLVMIAVMGIVAAIAIPSLLRARVAANEAAAIAHAREVVNAQRSFQSMSGSYGTMECLAAPGSCLPNYPADGPVLLSAESTQPQANGYDRAVLHADAESFVYVSGPVTPGQTGIRAFCADAGGMVCSAPSVGEASAGSRCSPACRILR